MNTEDHVREVKRRHAPSLLAHPGVVGVGVSRDEVGDYILVLYLATDDPEILADLPSRIEDVQVKFVYSGAFDTFASD